MHETIRNYLKALELEGRGSSVPGFGWILNRYDAFLRSRGLGSPTRTTPADLEAFQRHLAEEYRRPDNGKPLMKSTQATWLGTVKSFYAWLYRRGQIPRDPAKAIRIPKVVRRKVRADALDQQEAMAMVQTQARRVEARKAGSLPWAAAYRDLALLCLALATGRRRGSLRGLKVADLDFERREVRVEWEKGRPGRVLPCCGWALDVAKAFVEQARPVLLGKRDDPGWLFVALKLERIRPDHLSEMLRSLRDQAVLEHPDLEELADKRLSGHSTRVTFAKMLFLNGAGIRVLNDLLLHRQLQTTARYTPLGLDDLRRACRAAHPRA